MNGATLVHGRRARIEAHEPTASSTRLQAHFRQTTASSSPRPAPIAGTMRVPAKELPGKRSDLERRWAATSADVLALGRRPASTGDGAVTERR
jgi:hypothetical protein